MTANSTAPWRRNVNAIPRSPYLRKTADALIAATNSCDVDAVLTLFAPSAAIEDPSTGHRFVGHSGIRAYIEQFFVGYYTVTRLLSLEKFRASSVRLRVDFTGDFGHEIGLLELAVDAAGRIVRLDASLEKVRGEWERNLASRSGRLAWIGIRFQSL